MRSALLDLLGLGNTVFTYSNVRALWIHDFQEVPTQVGETAYENRPRPDTILDAHTEPP